MKGPVIVIILVTILFGGGFVSFENKKGKYGAELERARSEYKTLKEKLSGMEALRNRRAHHFAKIYFLNRPASHSLAVSEFLNYLSGYGSLSLQVREVLIERKTGKFDFRIKLAKGTRGREGLDDFVNRLESATGAFIISETETADGRGFELSGEVSEE